MSIGGLYTDDDVKLVGKALVVRYFKVIYNRHEHGFEKGIGPILDYCRQNDVHAILLDLEETTHIESMTLGSIIKFKKEITDVGITNIKLFNPSPEVGDAIEMQNLDKVFGKPYFSLEEAVKDLEG